MKLNFSFFAQGSFRSWITIFSVAFCATFTGLSNAQWAWKDSAGRSNYSDRPPPIEIPEKSIFQRPAGVKTPAQNAAAVAAVKELEQATGAPTAAGTPTASTATATTTGASAASAPKSSASAPALTKDAELEKRKKEKEAQEAAKKKQEEEKLAAARKDNCERAKSAKAGLDSGVRIARTNVQGEREFLGDEARAAETKRLTSIISADCKM